MSRRADRWVNERNKFGGAKDPITITRYFSSNRLDRAQLDALYEHDWLTRRVIDIPGKDAAREWITLTHETDPAKAEKARDELERLDVRGAVQEAITLGRLYGGSVMILGAFDGQEVFQPLNKVKAVHFISNVDRFLAFPQTFYNDPLDMRYGQVETYLVHRLQVQGSLTSLVHESRVIRFEGNYLPPLTRMRNFGWSAPVVQNLYEALRQFGISTQSGAAVLEDFVTKKLKIGNLQELLLDDEGEQKLIRRIALIASEMAINNVAVYGDDEEFEKMGTPITNLPELMRYFMDIVSAASEIPKARLFHSESGVLGGDQGKNDLRIHYDNIKAFQENTLRAKIRRIIDVLTEPLGYAPGEIDFTFNPLWQLSEAEDADVRLKTAQGDEIYIRNDVVEPQEVAISRFGGDGINIQDMNINVEMREKFLDALAKQPIDLDEPDDNEGGDEEVDQNTGQTGTPDNGSKKKASNSPT